MSHKVHITKDGLVVFDWDSESQQYVVDPDYPAISCLNLPCHIDPGVTLGDIFRVVDAQPKLMEFIGAYAWCNCAAFHAEALKPVVPNFKPEKEEDRLTSITIHQYCEIHDFTKSRYNLGWDAGMYTHINGVSASQSNWGISFTPMNEMAHLPVILDPVLKIFKDHELMGEGKESVFTLLQVLGDGIYYEIRFHGGPEARDEVGRSLLEMKADIDAGTATLVPWEDLKYDPPVQ